MVFSDLGDIKTTTNQKVIKRSIRLHNNFENLRIFLQNQWKINVMVFFLFILH